MGKTIKKIATSAGFLFLLQSLGCAPTTRQAANQQMSPATPNITQVLPQTIAAGSQSTTIKVTGTNFSSQSAILWNGAPLSTTVVDSNTLSSTVGGSSLATPTTVQLQVQDKQSMKSSQVVPVTITGADAGPSSALSISIASLPQGVVGSSYSGDFTAVGGASPYTWSVSSGQLPPGLTLAANTGVLSGTPTVGGNYNFGIKLIDSSSSVQSATTTVSLPVVTEAPVTAPLSITSTSIPPGTIGSAYSTVLQSSGGTAPYAWSITTGGLPNGLNFSATTGLISGTPTAVGATNFTASIADSSNPAQSRSVSLSIVIAAATASGSGTVWHIRHDGGDNIQCTGTTNAAYPGSGTGLPCAYNHPFQMLNYSGAWTAFAPGDTMEFDDPPSNTTPYYMGEQNGGVGMDWQPTIGGICPPPNSPASQGASCVLPILPSGVTIKGQNYGSCHTAGHTGLVNPTVLSGINGAFAVLQVGGTSNVTISCIEVTQPDNCTSAGYSYGPGQCGQSSNYVNYAGLMLEYQTGQGPANMTLTDFAVVGTSNRGIMGSHLNLLSTDTFTASDVYVIGNGQAGWDGDGGGCNNSCESVGTMNIRYADIEWNGCMAVKPYNIGLSPEANPNGFNYCYGQNTSGYGDGFVQLAAGNLKLNIDHSTAKYNTQDGFDLAHMSDDPTTNPAISITNSWSEGNAGQTFKIGAGASSTAINNVSISNCHVLTQASTFPNNPSGWVTLDGGDTCRAAGDEWALTLRPNTSITLQNNTSVGYGTVMYDLECSGFVPNCNGATFVFTNNLSKGYPDPTNSQQLASGLYFGPGLSSAIATVSNNLWNTMRTGCPDTAVPQETNYVCADPLLAAESNIDAINPSLTSTSPAIGAGVSINGIMTDFNNVTRPSPPSIGAQEPPQ